MEYDAPGPGQCIVHSMGGELLIERADPVVAIPEALVAQVRDGKARHGFTLDGKTLVIAAGNQTVSYRLEQCPQPGYLLGKLA